MKGADYCGIKLGWGRVSFEVKSIFVTVNIFFQSSLNILVRIARVPRPRNEFHWLLFLSGKQPTVSAKWFCKSKRQHSCYSVYF